MRGCGFFLPAAGKPHVRAERIEWIRLNQKEINARESVKAGCLRRATLYPAELRVHAVGDGRNIAGGRSNRKPLN